MDFKFNDADGGRRVVFEGSLICKNSRAIERFILEMVRQRQHLKIDLSEITEIDRCGVHLLAMIKSFGTEFVEIVATSPIIDVAMTHMPLARRKQHSPKEKITPHPVSSHSKPRALNV